MILNLFQEKVLRENGAWNHSILFRSRWTAPIHHHTGFGELDDGAGIDYMTENNDSTNSRNDFNNTENDGDVEWLIIVQYVKHH